MLIDCNIYDCSNCYEVWWIWFCWKVYQTQVNPSPEVTSKVSPNEEHVINVNILKEKLAAAIVNISAK